MLGGILSIFITVTLLIFFGYKVNFLLFRDGESILQTVKHKHYTQDDEFTEAQGLMIAVSMTMPLEPKVGKLQIIVDEFDWTDIENTYKRYEPLQTHTCTAEELGLEKSKNVKPHLFPLADGEGDYDNNKNGWLCIDEHELKLFGS